MSFTRRLRRKMILEEKAAGIALEAQEVAMALVRDTAYQKLRGVARTWTMLPCMAQAGPVGWVGLWVGQLLALAQARFFVLQLEHAMARLHERVQNYNARAAELLDVAPDEPDLVTTEEPPELVRPDGSSVDAPRLIYFPDGQVHSVAEVDEETMEEAC